MNMTALGAIGDPPWAPPSRSDVMMMHVTHVRATRRPICVTLPWPPPSCLDVMDMHVRHVQAARWPICDPPWALQRTLDVMDMHVRHIRMGPTCHFPQAAGT